MESYSNFISQFEILENPPTRKGFHRHHIVPQSEQTEKDDRQVYLTLPQHMWAHILYDQENGTHTARPFLTMCNKPIEYFDCLEKCLSFDSILSKKNEERIKKITKSCRTSKTRKKMSDSHKGKPTWNKGKKGCFSEETLQKLSEKTKLRMGEKNPWYGKHLSEEHKKKQSDSMKGKNTWAKGRHWYNNGIEQTQADECPEGFWPGRLPFKKSHEQAS